MSELSTEDILRDKKTSNPNSITSLILQHKALFDVSCLICFKNLEKLDLAFNTLTSLKGLEACLNLKWLSVQQNNLHSLRGIEALTNLTVFNAGKNKLTSMDEVKCLVKLRALILNDNDIALISGLDQLLELNTLVLSRNPIRKVGSSLAKLKSIEKISLSNCQLECVDNSIKACTELQQLRLAHNDIKTLPAELAYNKKLQILDLGNNMISRWPDLEVLSSLHNLKNLNLLGNPIAEKVRLIKKVKKLVPTLHILNSKRLDKLSSEKDQKVGDAVVSVGDEPKGPKPFKEKKKVHAVKHNSMDVDFDEHANQKGLNGDHKLAKDRGFDDDDDDDDVAQSDGENEQKKRKKKREKHVERKVLVKEADETIKDKRSKRKVEKAHLDLIDDKETSFAELVAYDATENMKPNDGKRRDGQAVGKFDAISALVTYPAKKKKSKKQDTGISVLQFLTPEIGLGGQSAWSDHEE